jgi:hypothetical protein
MIFQTLISPSPLSPPARGGEVLLVSRLSILRKPSIFRRYKSGDDCVIGDTWHERGGRFGPQDVRIAVSIYGFRYIEV